MAVVLAVIIITILYSMISGGITIGERGVGNITERTEDGDRGMNLDFASSDVESFPKPYNEINSPEASL